MSDLLDRMREEGAIDPGVTTGHVVSAFVSVGCLALAALLVAVAS